MMVGIYPQNQKIFKQALNIIYDADQAIHLNLTKDESIALTDKKIHGKTVEDILHLSFISKKQIQLKPEKSEEELTTVVTVSKTPKLEIIKATFDTK